VGFTLIFLNTIDASESYTEREHRAWLRAAGCVDIVRAPFVLCDGFGSGLITARKRGSQAKHAHGWGQESRRASS